jgi:hypothetical protein
MHSRYPHSSGSASRRHFAAIADLIWNFARLRRAS